MDGQHARTPATAQKSVSESRRVSTGSIKSDSALDMAISNRDTSPMNRTSMCPTASSPSVKTTQSPDASCTSSDRSSRSRALLALKVSARTGVSMNRLQGPTNNRQDAQLSDNHDVRSATEVSHLEDSALTAILWDRDSMMTASSISSDQPCMNTATTQPSMTASHLGSASASCGSSCGHRSRTPGRHTPATNRTAKSTSASSTTKTARSMASTTSHGPSMSRATPNRTQSISTARPYSPYSTNRSSMSAYHPPGAAPTHVYPNQQTRGQPLGSISQAPLFPSLTGRSSGHPTALEISDNEAIGRGIGRALTGDNSGSSTSKNRSANSSAKKAHPNKKSLLRTSGRIGTPTGSMYGLISAAKKTRRCKKMNLPKPGPQGKPMNRTAKKARPCKKVSIPEPRSQTSQDLDSTSTSTSTTNYSELSASAVSATDTVATTLLDSRKCRECGNPRTLASAQKKPVPAENPSVQVFQTNDGLRFRVKMRLDAHGLIKTGNSASTARFGATASACLPAGVEPEKAIINGNVYQLQLPSHQ